MAEILHKITIAAQPAAIYAALTEQSGLARRYVALLRLQ